MITAKMDLSSMLKIWKMVWKTATKRISRK